MEKRYFLPVLMTCILLGISCSKEKEEEAPTNLFDIEELVLEAAENKIDLKFNKVKSDYFFSAIYNDVTPDSVVTYEFKNNEDVIQGEWFKVVTDKNRLYISTKENSLNTSRKFRILYSIPFGMWYALSVIQKGKD